MFLYSSFLILFVFHLSIFLVIWKDKDRTGPLAKGFPTEIGNSSFPTICCYPYFTIVRKKGIPILMNSRTFLLDQKNRLVFQKYSILIGCQALPWEQDWYRLSIHVDWTRTQHRQKKLSFED